MKLMLILAIMKLKLILVMKIKKIYNIIKMEPVKRKEFEIGDYVYDNKRNFHWFKIIDNHFHEMSFYLEEFLKILYNYHDNIIKHKYKDFDDHKNDKKIKLKKL